MQSGRLAGNFAEPNPVRIVGRLRGRKRLLSDRRRYSLAFGPRERIGKRIDVFFRRPGETGEIFFDQDLELALLSHRLHCLDPHVLAEGPV